MALMVLWGAVKQVNFTGDERRSSRVTLNRNQLDIESFALV